jgi:hypothetical protein
VIRAPVIAPVVVPGGRRYSNVQTPPSAKVWRLTRPSALYSFVRYVMLRGFLMVRMRPAPS